MSFQGKNVNVAKCPSCGEKVKIKHPAWVGQPIDCPACEAFLEIARLFPFSLEWTYEDDEFHRIEIT
jgi:tRNA G26 N,N-dimethylase Trm1